MGLQTKQFATLLLFPSSFWAFFTVKPFKRTKTVHDRSIKKQNLEISYEW